MLANISYNDLIEEEVTSSKENLKLIYLYYHPIYQTARVSSNATYGANTNLNPSVLSETINIIDARLWSKGILDVGFNTYRLF